MDVHNKDTVHIPIKAPSQNYYIPYSDPFSCIQLFKLIAIGEELDTLYEGAIILSFGLTVCQVGFSTPSIQVNIVWASTELKSGLATLAYDFCTDDVNFNINMSREENIEE